MRKLSYFILGIIILFVLIFAITPLFIGSQVKSYVNTEATALQKKHPDASIAISNYQRHWFSSDATFTISYRLPFLFSGGCRSKPLLITLNAHVKHGPLVSYSVDGKKYHELAKSVLTLTSPKMNGQIIAISGWHNTIKTVFDVESFADKSTAASFTLKDLNGYLDYDESAKAVNYKISLADFQHTKLLASGNKDTMQSTNNKFTGKMDKKEGLWIGTLNSSRDNLSITRNKTAMLSLKNLQTAINSKTADERANYKMSMKAADVTIAGEPLGAMSWNASVSNAYIKSLTQMSTFAQKICSSNNFSLSNMIALSSPVLTLIEKGVTINIQNFTLNPTDSGPIHLTASLQFIQAPQGITILNALKYMSANGNVTVPREFLLQQLTEFYQSEMSKNPDESNSLSASQKADAAISDWINNKMLIEKSDNTLETSVTAKNGEILINGEAPNFKITTHSANHPKRASPSKTPTSKI